MSTSTASPFRQGWLALAGTLALIHGAADGQLTAKVSVNLGKTLNPLTSTSIGAPEMLNDGNSFQMATLPYLKGAGLMTLRFPGSNTSADLYHWATNTASPYKGLDVPYRAPESTFANVARLVDQNGTALVVVNYGTNQAGTGGGEPPEAAAWVAYANSKSTDGAVLGKDSSGYDWKTSGYWATIRGQAPLATDDGLNFLRINHPEPLRVRLWQIGSQVYNNGYYGGEHVGEPDLHGPAPNALKDFGKLRKNPNLSPAFYGAQITEFAKAMKAVDPSVQIGATFVTPPEGLQWAADWDSTVLKKACKDIDFVTLEWVTGKTMPPDWHTLDEGEMLDNARAQLNGILTGVLYDDKNNCPKDHIPKLAFSPAGVITWAKVDHPAAEALWVADVYALLVETGSVNVSLPELYSDNMVSGDRKKVGPVFSGMQMLHIVAHNPGDVLVDATSTNPKLAVHAARRRDGVFGLMLVNKDSSAPITVRVNIAGGQVGTKGRRFDYGMVQQKAGTGVAPMEIKDVSGDFSVTVPPYTITDVLIEN